MIQNGANRRVAATAVARPESTFAFFSVLMVLLHRASRNAALWPVVRRPLERRTDFSPSCSRLTSGRVLRDDLRDQYPAPPWLWPPTLFSLTKNAPLQRPTPNALPQPRDETCNLHTPQAGEVVPGADYSRDSDEKNPWASERSLGRSAMHS